MGRAVLFATAVLVLLLHLRGASQENVTLDSGTPPMREISEYDAVYGSGNHSWMDVGDCGKGLACNETCQLLCLKMHNYYRSLHNAPPLKCDPELAKSAAQDGEIHSQWTEKYTESIWKIMDKLGKAIPSPTRSWYSEIKNDYNYQTGKGSAGRGVGHFKALIWKGTKSLGCGISMVAGDSYVTAHYAPASHANVVDTSRDNVLPREEPEPACNVRSSDRVPCPSPSAPLVTPEQCIIAGCCYDDVFLSEPSVYFYGQEGQVWCFKKKG